jgi:hypothetical protein
MKFDHLELYGHNQLPQICFVVLKNVIIRVFLLGINNLIRQIIFNQVKKKINWIFF